MLTLTLLSLTALPRPAVSEPAVSEPAAVRLLAQVEAKARALKGFSCDLTAKRTFAPAKAGGTATEVEQRVHVEFARPNRFVLSSQNRGEEYRSISDGRHVYSVTKDSYRKEAIDPKARDFHWYHDDLLLLMVTGSFARAVEAPRPPTLRMLPKATWNGTAYRVLEARIEGGYPIAYRLFIGPDGFVRRIVHVEANDGRPRTIDSVASNLRPRTETDNSAFAFTPSEGMKEGQSVMALRPGEFPPVEVGATATDFSLSTPSGGKLSLGEAMKGSRAVLLNFWFVHCPPCRAEHPQLQRLYDELRPKGLAMIAVDDQDTAVQSAGYLKGAKLSFPVVLTGPRFRTDPKTSQIDYQGPSMPDYASLAPYGVRVMPTNILIDSKTGKVVWRSTGWDEAELRKALKGMGIG